jgi:hypothetical protein
LEKADKIQKTELKRSVIIHGGGTGDSLAAGAPSANFPAANYGSQERFDSIWLTDKKFFKKYGKRKAS